MTMATRLSRTLTLLAALLATAPLYGADPGVGGGAVGAGADAATQDAQRRAREAVLARDSIELFPQLRGSLVAEPQQEQFGQAVGQGRFIVRIRQVTNVSGNDPWHITQPVLNFNGVEVSDLATLIALANGGGGGGADGDPSDCVRGSTMLDIVPNTIWASDFDLNPNTLDCTMPPPGTIGDGSFSIVMDNPSTPGNTTYCIGGIPGTAWNPVAGPVCVAYTPGATVSFQAQSTSGRRIEIQFRATAGSPPYAEILAITPLN